MTGVRFKSSRPVYRRGGLILSSAAWVEVEAVSLDKAANLALLEDPVVLVEVAVPTEGGVEWLKFTDADRQMAVGLLRDGLFDPAPPSSPPASPPPPPPSPPPPPPPPPPAPKPPKVVKPKVEKAPKPKAEGKPAVEPKSPPASPPPAPEPAAPPASDGPGEQKDP